MEVVLPPGYTSAAPFDKSKHQRLGIRQNAAAFARTLNVIFLTQGEMPIAGHDYPVVFVRDSSDIVLPYAVTGLHQGTNYFCNESGGWQVGHYCPAYVRRYPFFTAGAVSDPSKAIICVDETGLSDSTPALLNATGEPTERWREVEVLIHEMDIEQRKTAQFTQRIEELKLLEPLEVDFHPVGKDQVRLGGMLRISEQGLGQLSGDELSKLASSGDLGRVYAHLLSLVNFNRLLDRYVQS